MRNSARKKRSKNPDQLIVLIGCPLPEINPEPEHGGAATKARPPAPPASAQLLDETLFELIFHRLLDDLPILQQPLASPLRFGFAISHAACKYQLPLGIIGKAIGGITGHEL